MGVSLAAAACGGRLGPDGCGNPSSPDEIMQGFQEEVPSQTWIHMRGQPGFECTPKDGCYPTEAALQKLLMAGACSGWRL